MDATFKASMRDYIEDYVRSRLCLFGHMTGGDERARVTLFARDDELRRLALRAQLSLDGVPEPVEPPESLGAARPAPAVKLCKDCRWMQEVALSERTRRIQCQRPVPLSEPDYVYGETTTPRGIGCLSERQDAPTSCGPAGRYWAAREAE